ncbi:hypothetical protein M0R45_024933 [Rubus argutus]|uniref:Uncharacterized protein n=1 Tax=Rubus argutus TaxID=59490 RepID=A0AAW1WT97_RUBAR
MRGGCLAEDVKLTLKCVVGGVDELKLFESISGGSWLMKDFVGNTAASVAHWSEAEMDAVEEEEVRVVAGGKGWFVEKKVGSG